MGGSSGSEPYRGLVLLVLPRGNPWAGITFFAPVLMGRALAPIQTISLPVSSLMHLGLAVVYGAIISAVVQRVTQFRALAAGGLIGLALYALNLGFVLLCFRKYTGTKFQLQSLTWFSE